MILDEQGRELPRGPLGLLMAPEVEIVANRPPEVLTIVDSYLAGKIGTMEFASRMETVRMKAFASPSM